MGYESAGIRFTEGPQGNRPAAQTPVQEAIQLLRLRVPKFSGAQSPAAPQLLAGNGSPPMMPTSAPMLQQLQPLLQALSGGTPAPDATNRPTFTGGEPTGSPQPNAALIQQLLQQIIQSQQRQFLPEGGNVVRAPQFQFEGPTGQPSAGQTGAPASAAPVGQLSVPTGQLTPAWPVPQGSPASPAGEFQPGPGYTGFGGLYGY